MKQSKHCFVKDTKMNYNYILSWNKIFNPFMTEAVMTEKPVHWFAEQINELVSICMKELRKNVFMKGAK